jgi:hypothetical protein
MHYDVDRRQLRALAVRFEELAEIQREVCQPDAGECPQKENVKFQVHDAEDHSQ